MKESLRLKIAPWMQNMDSREAIARIRGRTDRPQIPVFVFTSHTMRADREQCIAAAFADYLAKSILRADLEALFESIALPSEALQTGALTRLASEAHGMKGESLTLGVDELAEACRRVEEAALRGDQLHLSTESVCLFQSWERIRDSLKTYMDAYA